MDDHADFDIEEFDIDDVDDTPTVSCTVCDREWDLDFELDELHAGNQAFEQFALDHQRHAGHFPDGVTPWVADCRHCPGGEEFLSERPARRWARTHARHTRHRVALRHENVGDEGGDEEKDAAELAELIDPNEE